MEVTEQAELFKEDYGHLVFHHTNSIYTDVNKRLQAASKLHVDALDLIRIPTDDLWPKFEPRSLKLQVLCLLVPLSPPSSFVKQPSLPDFGDSLSSLKIDEQILNEAEVCEMLKKHPHLNLARCFGCVVKGGRTRGLCFFKYATTLSQVVRSGRSFDTTVCLKGIQEGLAHLHSLGLIHGDINPSTVMMQGSDTVMIDFDSCTREDMKLSVKGGTPGWEVEGAEFARRKNDFYGLSRIRQYLDSTSQSRLQSWPDMKFC